MLKSFVTNKVKVVDRYTLISSIKKIIPGNKIKQICDFYKMATWNQLNKLKDNTGSQVSFAIHGGLHLPFDKEEPDFDYQTELVNSKTVFEKRLCSCDIFSIV